LTAGVLLSGWQAKAILWQDEALVSERGSIPPKECNSGGSSMTISQKVVAIIDDDRSIRDAVARLVAALGYRTEVYSSGEEFINAAIKSEAGCLIIDIQLGDLTGVELARHLSAMGLTFPVIFMTGSHNEIVRKQASEFGCVAYLLKPFPADQLIKAITEAIGTASDV
jgi:FixJ family two-component response regulator